MSASRDLSPTITGATPIGALPAHTSGPWIVDPNHKTYVLCDGARVVASTYGRSLSQPAQEANARLMAAAPELLEAVKAWDFAFMDFDPEDQASRMAMRKVILGGRSAIAKALGLTSQASGEGE